MIGLLDKIIAAGGDVWVVGGDLRLRVPGGLLTQAERSLLAENKAEIVKLLASTTAGPAAETPVVVATMPERVVDPGLDQQAGPVEFTTPEGMTIRFADPVDEAEIVTPPPPCPQCGGFMFWWDFLGRPHCQQCELATRSARTREAAERIRRRGKPAGGPRP